MNQATSSKIRVLLVEDHAIVRHGLTAIIEREPDLTVVAQAADGQVAVELFRQHQPDVTLMDLRMPKLSGFDAMLEIRAQFNTAKIIVLTTFDGDEDIRRALQAGASGYLLKDAPAAELLAAVRSVYKNSQFIPNEIKQKFLKTFVEARLTKRELLVLHEIAAGKTNQQIAAALNITQATVKTHINRMLSKLNAHDRTAAVVIGLKRGLIHL